MSAVIPLPEILKDGDLRTISRIGIRGLMLSKFGMDQVLQMKMDQVTSVLDRHYPREKTSLSEENPRDAVLKKVIIELAGNLSGPIYIEGPDITLFSCTGITIGNFRLLRFISIAEFTWAPHLCIDLPQFPLGEQIQASFQVMKYVASEVITPEMLTVLRHHSHVSLFLGESIGYSKQRLVEEIRELVDEHVRARPRGCAGNLVKFATLFHKTGISADDIEKIFQFLLAHYLLDTCQKDSLRLGNS